MTSIQCSTPAVAAERCAKTHFGENQLLPGSISFSLLPAAHPMVLHGQRVRASPRYYTGFTLATGSSPGFGSRAHSLPMLRIGEILNPNI